MIANWWSHIITHRIDVLWYTVGLARASLKVDVSSIVLDLCCCLVFFKEVEVIVLLLLLERLQTTHNFSYTIWKYFLRMGNKKIVLRYDIDERCMITQYPSHFGDNGTLQSFVIIMVIDLLCYYFLVWSEVITAIDVKEGSEKPPYHFQFFTLEPNWLFLLVLLHADMVFYVHKGSGKLTWANDGGTSTIPLREGDLCSLNEGSVFYIQRNLEAKRRKLRIYTMFTNTEDNTFDPLIGAYSRINIGASLEPEGNRVDSGIGRGRHGSNNVWKQQREQEKRERR
ncbi:hypothetical protein Fmac_025569 [Flemingia macrophylla]|uniref:Uncharacterized protein n=1 Tax=Flemingia macrophylla TaxID=520843 RepID=A0ABD1LSQ5_9FABA